jgi:uncharacterized protein
MRRFVWLLALLFLACCVRAQEPLPAAPRRHFNDYAGLVTPSLAHRLDAELDQFERDTSNQILVAILRRLPDGAAVEDFTVRTFHAWKVGQKDRNNGVVLFIFKENRKVYIQTGYGLEGALPDALCKRIIADQITPEFRRGNYDGGVEKGVHAILSATKGEYKGTGRTARSEDDDFPPLLVAIVIFIVLAAVLNRFRGGGFYGGHGPGPTYWGGSDSPGSGSSGGGNFSGGGGDSGGGGAGGDW